MTDNINNLLGRYMAGTLDREGRRELREAIQHIDDEVLSGMLYDAWINYDEPKEPGIAFEKLISGIKPVRRRGLSARFFMRAAAVLLPVLVAVQVWFAVENRRLSDFIDRPTAVNVQSGEKAAIDLPDGTRVLLNSGTTLNYTGGFGLDRREVFLDGEAWFEVAHDAPSPFFVNAGPLVIEVTGTKFNVNAYSSSQVVETTLPEGGVKVYQGATPSIHVTLAPGRKAVYERSDRTIRVMQTNGWFETAWTRGELVFRSEYFEGMAVLLERRYGVKIDMDGPMPSDPFTGTFREDNINSVLNILQMHYAFQYTYDKGRITIYFE